MMKSITPTVILYLTMTTTTTTSSIAFQVPRRIQHSQSSRRNHRIRSPARLLSQPSSSARQSPSSLQWQSSAHDYCHSSFSPSNSTADSQNSRPYTEEVDGHEDAYFKLLQQFLEEHAHEAMIDLQELNYQAATASSAATMSAATLTRPSTPTATLSGSSTSSISRTNNQSQITTVIPTTTIEPQQQQLDSRDEGDLWRARFLLVGAAALYGTNFALVKLLGDTMPVGISTTLRFGLAALATMPWLMDSKLLTSKNAQTAAWLGLEVGMWNSVGYVAQAVGLETTLASKSAFICSMAVVIVPLLEFMTGERLLPRQWVGALMALVGVAFLELGGGGGIGDAVSSLTTGDALSLIQPVMFGVGFWKMEKAMHQFPEEAQRMTAAQLFAVFLASAAYGVWSVCDVAVATDSSLSLSTIASSYPWKEWVTDPSILFSLFWTGCITTALTIYMETLALETLSATETTLIFSTEPLWGTAFAAVVMGEQLGANAGVGAFFILTACIYSNLGKSGLEKLWRHIVGWMATNNASTKQQPSWLQSLRERWMLLPSSLLSSIATWNVATSSLKAQELNEIVDELMEKFL
mmetsp:Transcript_24559/g.45835  ORF Transcript_24559/g.45835 Transcript_24559/m.45835 type:complete len:580 (+) Transcript_24559:216-1955(+)